MKELLRISAIVALIVGTAASSIAQNSASNLDNAIAEYVAAKTDHTVQVGQLMCENAEGQKALCTGDLSETVIGVITSAPYVTLNKPQNAEGSKYVFDAFVSDANGEVAAGDYLKAIAGGNLGKCAENEIPFAYAIALEDSKGNAKISIKVLK